MTETGRPHPHVAVAVDGPVATVTIDRPEALGALSRGIVETLHRIVADLRRDTTVRAVVFTGTGRAFIAGADIGEYHDVDQQAFDAYQRLGYGLFDAVEALPQYTIAAVNGYALGGGFELALCCDEILAVERASFGLPEVRLGLIPGGGGTQRLARAVGPYRASRLLATGDRVRAHVMHEWGVVSEVVADAATLEAAAGERARAVAASAPLAAREAVRLARTAFDRPLATGLDDERATLSRLYGSRDATEGIAAFVEKRAPVFEGR